MATQSEYEKTDKFDLTINGWGGEDLKFFETCVNYKVKQSCHKSFSTSLLD